MVARTRMTMAVAAAAAFLIMGAPAVAQPARPAPAEEPPIDKAELERMLAGESQVHGADLERRIRAAAAHPLGSKENPVRADMPKGQRAYLQRLRCGNGRAPQFRRVGNIGEGIYGNFVDGYETTCAGAKPVVIYMDMYHNGHVEERPVPGFTIAASLPSV